MSSSTTRRGSAMSGNVRTGNAASPASLLDLPAPRPIHAGHRRGRTRQRYGDRGADPGAVARRTLVRGGPLIVPPPGESLLRPATGRGPALQVGTIGGRTQHLPRPRVTPMECAPPRTRTARVRPTRQVRQRTPRRVRGTDRHRPERDVDDGDRCRHRRSRSPRPSVTGRQAVVAAGEAVAPSRPAVRLHLDGDGTTGDRPPFGHGTVPTMGVAVPTTSVTAPTRHPTAARSGPRASAPTQRPGRRSGRRRSR